METSARSVTVFQTYLNLNFITSTDKSIYKRIELLLFMYLLPWTYSEKNYTTVTDYREQKKFQNV